VRIATAPAVSILPTGRSCLIACACRASESATGRKKKREHSYAAIGQQQEWIKVEQTHHEVGVKFK
jgi:hypothetical protein